jgi:hypothetical protein
MALEDLLLAEPGVKIAAFHSGYPAILTDFQKF